MKKKLRWKIAQYIELLWWKRYLKRKGISGYSSWKNNFWQEMLDKVQTDLNLKKGDSVLDAGCGPAGIFLILDGYDVIAVDPLINAYKRNLPYFNTADYPYVKFINSPLEDYRPDHKFKVCFCLNAINHVANIEACVKNLTEHAASGGFIVLSIDAHKYSLIKAIFKLIPGDVLHPYQYSLGEYERMFTGEKTITTVERVLLRKELLFDHHLLVFRKSGLPSANLDQ